MVLKQNLQTYRVSFEQQIDPLNCTQIEKSSFPDYYSNLGGSSLFQP